jgi:hypothetical protein
MHSAQESFFSQAGLIAFKQDKMRTSALIGRSDLNLLAPQEGMYIRALSYRTTPFDHLMRELEEKEKKTLINFHFREG